jgi:predicted amidohydrolase
MRLAVAQSIAAPGDLAHSIADHARLAIAAAHERARLLVFPELSLTGYRQDLTIDDAIDLADPRLAPLQFLANEHGMWIATGAPIASPAGLHIGAIVFTPQDTAYVHLKQYLHPGEEVAFVPGSPGETLTIDDVRVGLAICADFAHPEHARAAADRGCAVYAAGVLITPEGYEADAAMLRDRATRHRMLVMIANYGAPTGGWLSAGRSAVWSPDGDLLACAPSSGEALVFVDQVNGQWRAEALGLFQPAGT